VKATFQHSHIDRKPLGNIRDTLITLMTGHPHVDLLYEHRKGIKYFLWIPGKSKRTWGYPLDAPQVVSALRTLIQSGLEELESLIPNDTINCVCG